MIGRVVSTKMNKPGLSTKTVTVLVERVAKHPLYKKTFIQSKRYLVDAQMEIKDGDMVEIIKIRPISKNKHWKVTRIIGKSLEEITAEQLRSEAEKMIAEVMPEEKETEETSDAHLAKQASLQTEEMNKKEEKPKRRKEKSKS